MKTYKGWTEKERRESQQKTLEAIKRGEIPRPTRCNRCGTTKKVRYHNRDYSHPTKYLEPLCFGCHLKEHREKQTNQLDLWEGKI